MVKGVLDKVLGLTVLGLVVLQKGVKRKGVLLEHCLDVLPVVKGVLGVASVASGQARFGFGGHAQAYPPRWSRALDVGLGVLLDKRL